MGLKPNSLLKYHETYPAGGICSFALGRAAGPRAGALWIVGELVVPGAVDVGRGGVFSPLYWSHQCVKESRETMLLP